jgi:hypothetical protein
MERLALKDPENLLLFRVILSVKMLRSGSSDRDLDIASMEARKAELSLIV